MKKFAWIIALLAALSLGFFSCAEPEGSSYRPARVAAKETEWTTIFNMQESEKGLVPHEIQDLPEGALTFGADSDPSPIAPLVRAGSHTVTVKKAGGKNTIEYNTTQDWGPGIDLPHPDFGFQTGDKITITGTVAGSSIDLMLNRRLNNQEAIGTRITSAGAFTLTATLTATDINTMLAAPGNGNGTKVLRLENRAVGMTTTITQILIEGERPTNIRTLAPPVITLTGDVLSWAAIEDASGYKLYANEVLVSTVETTRINLKSAFNGKDAGSYTVKLIAAGTAGTTKDSPASNTRDYVYASYNVPITIKVDGADKTAALKLIGTTAEFEAVTDGFKVNGGYSAGSSFPMLVFDFGTTTKLSDISRIQFKAKQVDGDIAYKRFNVLAAEDTATAASSFKAITRKTTNRWEGAPAAGAAATPINVNLPVFKALVDDSGSKDKSKLAFSLNPAAGVSAVYEITDIEITTGSNAANETISGFDLLNVVLAVPVGGIAPVTSITKADGGENTVYTATVKWNPSVGTTFDVVTFYQALITLTPAITYVMPSNPSGFRVNGSSSDPDKGVPDEAKYGGGIVALSYNFPDSTGVPGHLGVIYDLLADNSFQNATSIGNYWTFGTGTDSTAKWFRNANGGGSILQDDNPKAEGKKFIKFVNPNNAQNWNSILIITTGLTGSNPIESNIPNYSYGRSHTITVVGKTHHPGASVRFERAGSPYGSYSGGGTSHAETGEFTLTRTFTWPEIVDSIEGIGIRSAKEVDGTNQQNHYDIYNITVTAVAAQ